LLYWYENRGVDVRNRLLKRYVHIYVYILYVCIFQDKSEKQALRTRGAISSNGGLGKGTKEDTSRGTGGIAIAQTGDLVL
jgi:hypothetical protein